jgi:hypothetical protein
MKQQEFCWKTAAGQSGGIRIGLFQDFDTRPAIGLWLVIPCE